LPAELFVLDAESSSSSGLRRLTHVNDELLKTIALADAEEERFPTLDGTEIQAFVYKPPSFDPTLKYPTLVWLHGGQESQYDFGFEFRVQLFAANGYVVVMPNVRGSGGRGLDFTLSNYRYWVGTTPKTCFRQPTTSWGLAMPTPTGSASAAGRTEGRLRTT
jgi:dipeptidyl aminopeptidase/acylaminoacyl peptidase